MAASFCARRTTGRVGHSVRSEPHGARHNLKQRHAMDHYEENAAFFLKMMIGVIFFAVMWAFSRFF